MKKLSILALSATVAIAPAFAETTTHYNTPSVDIKPVLLDVSLPTPATAQADLSFAFGDTTNLQVTDMTLVEMQETEGAWVTTVVDGAVGGAGYAYGAYKGNYKWDNRNFVGNVASGAVIGTLTGGAGYIASGGAKFIPSLANAGANIWRANGAIANAGANTAWRR